MATISGCRVVRAALTRCARACSSKTAFEPHAHALAGVQALAHGVHNVDRVFAHGDRIALRSLLDAAAAPSVPISYHAGVLHSVLATLHEQGIPPAALVTPFRALAFPATRAELHAAALPLTSPVTAHCYKEDVATRVLSGLKASIHADAALEEDCCLGLGDVKSLCSAMDAARPHLQETNVHRLWRHIVKVHQAVLEHLETRNDFLTLACSIRAIAGTTCRTTASWYTRAPAHSVACVELLEAYERYYREHPAVPDDVHVLIDILRCTRALHVLPGACHTALISVLASNVEVADRLYGPQLRDVLFFVCGSGSLRGVQDGPLPAPRHSAADMQAVRVQAARSLLRRVSAAGFDVSRLVALHYLLHLTPEELAACCPELLQHPQWLSNAVRACAPRVPRAVWRRTVAALSARASWPSDALQPPQGPQRNLLPEPRDGRMHSQQERVFARVLRKWSVDRGMPLPVLQYPSAEGYTLDVAWPVTKCAVEVDGPFHSEPMTLEAFASTFKHESTCDKETGLHFVGARALKTLWAAPQHGAGASGRTNATTALRNAVLRHHGWKLLVLTSSELEGVNQRSGAACGMEATVYSLLDELLWLPPPSHASDTSTPVAVAP